MAAVKPASLQHQHSNVGGGSDYATAYLSSLPYDRSPRKLSRLSSSKSLGNNAEPGAFSPSPRSYAGSSKQNGLRATLRNIDTGMTKSNSNPNIPATTSNTPSNRSESRLAKLHKRESSASSLPANPSPLSAAHSQFTTPFATAEEPFPDISSTTPTSSTPKIRPYLRKLSTAKDDTDQGRLDLSKSTSENEALSGLGIQDRSASVSDINFSHTTAGRRTPHMRTTSIGSQASTTQPFIHPMRQTPNVVSYTPTTTTYSNPSSLDEDEARESTDTVPDDHVHLTQNLRNRSTSLTQQQQTNPTPLSQSHTAADLTASQSNLSFLPTSLPYARTSLEPLHQELRAETEPAGANGRDERIRDARRKFEAKEALKDRKKEMAVEKRRRKSEVEVGSLRGRGKMVLRKGRGEGEEKSIPGEEEGKGKRQGGTLRRVLKAMGCGGGGGGEKGG